MKIRKVILPLSFILILIALTAALRILPGRQPAQQAAARWAKDGSAAHISVFATSAAKFSTDDVFVLREKLKEALKEVNLTEASKSGSSDDKETAAASDKTDNGAGKTDSSTISKDTTPDSSSVFLDCYSAKGSLTVASSQTTASFTAYGVGGDFFFFHPLTLKSGAYFSEESMMDDYVVLDEDCAWQLFGSTDIAGMQITVNQKPLIIAGVVAREDSPFTEAAGNTKPTLYVSYQTLLSYGSAQPISCYEIILPNLTKGYAKRLVKENLDIKSSRREIIENSSRYRLTNYAGILKNFGKRSMQTKALVYPYWENQARATEDVCVLLFVLTIVDAAALLITAIILYLQPLLALVKSGWHSTHSRIQMLVKNRKQK